MIIAELNMKGAQHLMVNAGFLERFCNAGFAHTLLGDSRHIAELVLILSNNLKLKLFAVPVIRSGSSLTALAKTLLEILLVCFVFAFSLVKRQEILFLSSYPSVKVFIEMLSRVHPFRVFIVHHGELDGLEKSSNERYAKFVRLYFTFRKSKKLTDIFLSDGIRDNAIRLVGHNLPSYLSLLHPFPSTLRPVEPYTIEHLDPTLITIGYFGALTIENFPRVQNIIDALCLRVSKLGRQDFNLLIAAPNLSKLNFGTLTHAASIDTAIGLSNEEFSAVIENIDIAVFPYMENQYELSASGIASDCVIHQIHFLVARSTFFIDWIDEYKGSGTLFGTFEELLRAISNSALDLRSL